MAYLPPPFSTPPLDWKFSPPSRQRTLRTASDQSQRSVTGLNIKTDDAHLEERYPGTAGSTVTTLIQILNHPPNTNSGDFQNHFSLNDSPSSFQAPVFASSPIQATPQRSRQPQASSSNHSVSTSVPHPNVNHSATSSQAPPSKVRRGILVPAHAYLQKGSKEARAYAQRFGKFDYGGEVKVGAGAGGISGAAGSNAGWAIWVVDKW